MTQNRTEQDPTSAACVVMKSHLQGSADFHHIVLLYHSDSEVVGLHEFLQERPVVFILTPCKQKKKLLL